MQNNTLVGAGLVGSLLSVFMAKRGQSVDLYERRPDMRVEKISAGRSINLAISTRGLHALAQLGIKEEVLQHAIPMRGRMIHSIRGELTFQPYSKDETECINSISRGELNKILMNHAERTGRVRIHFNQKISSVDFKSNQLEVTDEVQGKLRKVPFRTLIGTDGSASAVRSEMMRVSGYTCSQTPLEHGYKELTLPADPTGKNGGFQMEKNALHIWPRGSYMLIALPNFDGSFTCTLFLPFHGPLSFDSLKTPKDVHELFDKQFPDAVPLIPNFVEQFFTNPTGHMVTVKSFPWNIGGKALLLGDAAHAIVPFFGQGMNCGFEDCTVFDDLINQEGPAWDRIFPLFGEKRKTHTDAIADMAVENFIEMRDKVADPRFLLEKRVEKLLHQSFPKHYIPRYSLVSFSRVPYRIAYQAGMIQSEILNELCDGLSGTESLDLQKAGQLIEQKLAPFMIKQNLAL